MATAARAPTPALWNADSHHERAVMPEPVRTRSLMPWRGRGVCAWPWPWPWCALTTAPAAHAGAASTPPPSTEAETLRSSSSSHHRGRLRTPLSATLSTHAPCTSEYPISSTDPRNEGTVCPTQGRDVLVEVGDDDPVLLVQPPRWRERFSQWCATALNRAPRPPTPRGRPAVRAGSIPWRRRRRRRRVPGVHDDHDVRRRHLRYVDVIDEEPFQKAPARRGSDVEAPARTKTRARRWR